MEIFSRIGAWSLRACICGLIGAVVALGGAARVSAQTGALGTIHGTVSDESGAALPGATVTLTSTALQVGKMLQVTQADGTYRFGDLPVGTYKITFELQGFKTFIRDEVRLPVGFVARIDPTMAVGGIEESVTVTGQSPVVDQTTTTTSVNISQDTLEAVPAGRGFQHLFAMTPGVTTVGAPDVGDSSMSSRNPIQNYGVQANAKIEVEGINISVGESSSVYFTTFAFEEVQLKTSGNDAEVSNPGISMVSVLKSGSNQFHGSYSAAGQRPQLESSNWTDRLRAQGLSETPPLKYYYEVAGDLGGRLIKDRLWFYVAANKQQRVSGILGFASNPGPDGKYLTPDDERGFYENNLTNEAVKISYQATTKNRLIGVYQPMLKYQPQRDAERFRPLEATTDYRNPGGIYKAELQSMISNHVVGNLVAGYGGNTSNYLATRSKAYPATPSKLDRESGLRYGSSDHNSKGHNDRWQTDGSLTFVPERFLGGHHELKTGTTLYWERAGEGKQHNPAGDYILVYDRVSGVSGRPVEIQIFNAPVEPINWQTIYSGYIKDTWRVSEALTLNLGVRFEQSHAYVSAQSTDASPQFPTLFPAASYAKLDVLTWRSVVPRFGLAWSLGDKTVVKTTIGRFNAGMNNGFAGNFNPNGNTTATFRWRDPNGNNDYDPGEVNLDTSALGPDFLGISGASTNVLNPDLEQPMTTEATAGLERELSSNLGFRALYVYKDFSKAVANTNIKRPRSAYNIPIVRRDPGPDGVLDTKDDPGQTITLWDYDAAYRGAAFVANQQQNSPFTSHYQSVEFTLTKRGTGRWFGMGSFWMTKKHRYTTLIPDDPNKDYFPIDDSWSWAGNVSGSYRFPWDVQLGAYLQSKIGFQGLRTNTFRAADPDGGTPLRQLSTISVNLEPFGTQVGPAISILDLRASKQFQLARGQRFELHFDVFNLLNSSAPTTITYVSGPTFGWYGVSGTSVNAAEGGILPPRVARVGLKYRF